MKVFKLFSILAVCLLTASLAAQWSNDAAANTAVATLDGSQVIPKIGIGPEGDVFVGFYSNESGNYDVRLQRFDASGTAMWEAGGILVSDNESMTWLTDWDMTVDHQNNAILAFQDIRSGNNDIYAYSISEDGEFNWGEDGLQLSDTPEFNASPKVCVTSENNAVIAWPGEVSVFMQKISPAGDLLWGLTSIALTGDNIFSWPQPIAIDNDEFILKLYDDSGPIWAPTRHVFAQRFDVNGSPVWDDYSVVSDAGGISAWNQILSIISDGENGIFIGWDDDRDSNNIEDGYVQHINSDGEALWAANGVLIATTANRQTYGPKLAYNANSQELSAFWRATDGGQTTYGIKGQNLDSGGNLLWGNDGLTFVSLSSIDIFMDGVSSSSFGNIIIYEESEDYLNSNVKAMLLDNEGNFVWENEIVTMSSVLSQKMHPDVSYFTNNNWIAVWEDLRNDGGDIYAQNISFNGELGPVQTMAGVSGTVIIFEGEGDVEDVLVSAGENSTNPSADGSYTLMLDPGIYAINASLEGYNTVIEEGVEVLEDTVTDNVNFLMELEAFDPPYNVQIDSDTGILTWEHPYVTGEEAEEGFEEAELPAGWLNLDADGDSLNWFLYTFNPHGGSQSIASASWVSPLGPLNPDNWLISPALDIGTDSELHFWYDAQDENYFEENFGVYISTMGNEIEDFTDNIFEVTVEGSEWIEAVLDLSEYLGETVHIAWRHFNCTNQFYLKIDDITLINSVTREIEFSADFENGSAVSNRISSRGSRNRELLSYNLYLDEDLVASTTDLTHTYTGLINGQSYNASVSAVYTYGESDLEGVDFTYEGTGSDDDLVADVTQLTGNYPNPFNPSTEISFQVSQNSFKDIELVIYNIKGQQVKDLSSSITQQPDNQYSITWAGTDDNDNPVPSGVYFYNLKAGSYNVTRKMVMLK